MIVCEPFTIRLPSKHLQCQLMAHTCWRCYG